MKNRLKKAIIFVLLIQVCLFGIVIFRGNTIPFLENEYLEKLDNDVLLRKNFIEEEMLQYRANATEFEQYVQQEVTKIGILNDLSLIPKLLKNIVNQSVVTLRQSGATEIFIILEGEKSHQGFYLRDLDPKFNSIDNSDILMERGSIDIAKKLNVALDTYWSNSFNLSKDEERSDFYFKPFQAAESYPELPIQDWGYWNTSFKLSEDDIIDVVSYSLPLVDNNGKPYGVIGLGVTADYLSKKLNYDELAANKRGAYLLSLDNELSPSLNKIVSSGPMYNILTANQIPTYEDISETIYKIKDNPKINEDVYASKHPLSLYNAQTPFENEKWNLIGLVGKNDLFHSLNKTITSIIISLVFSLVIGVIVMHLVGNWFMKPVNELMQRVMESNPEKPYKLIKTNIPEVDELALAIETLNNRVIDSSSKLTNIINMVNVPIGAFEYSINDSKAFCTNTLFEILGINHKTLNNYVSTSYLKEIINSVKNNPVIDMPNTYFHTKNNGSACWVQMKIQNQEGQVLGVIEDVTEDFLIKRKIEYERDHDALTHILNKRSFETIAKKKIQDKSLGLSAFIMWDLDNLKYINDTYGHEYGDRYIKSAAAVLNRFKVYNAIVGRISGDEFFTLIYDYKSKDEIRKIIKKIRESFNKTFLKCPDGELIRLRASAGVSWYPDDSQNYQDLIKYADFAMYEVKNKDKGNIAEFNSKSYYKNSILLRGKEELNNFIDQKLVHYAFQPIVNVKTGKIFAYEALMRPETKNLLSPYDILRLAQSESKLYEIEKLTWFESMAQFKEQKEKFKDAKIFINSIPNHVLSEDDLKQFEDLYADDLKRIVIEITENEQSDEETTKTKQNMVTKWGSHLALDDFGSGYNSELALLILSPKYVKIDMNIIRGIDTDKNRQKLLRNILSYAKNRSIKIIAEGVETKGEMDKLIEFGVDYVQGYYLGYPEKIPQELSSEKILEVQASFNRIP